MIIQKAHALRGEIQVPGDKSISHRSVMIGSLARGETRVRHFLPGADCLSTIQAFQCMGIDIEQNGEDVTIHGKGLHGLVRPGDVIDAGNSGTTVRLLSGILAGQRFDSTITGDASICRRPMKRVMTPLTMMGGQIRSLSGNGCAPLSIIGSPLHGIHYQSPVASAQVKSCVLFAGLYADGQTSVTEPALSRDHTEIMLRYFGADVKSTGLTSVVTPEPLLEGRDVLVPGDISSAAYFIAAGLLVPGSEILIRNVGINPTRDGILKVVRAMGGDVQLLNVSNDGEPTADLLVKYSSLHGTKIGGGLIPTLIDELPVIAVLAAFAEGTTVISDAAELRVKESDRITVMTESLKKLGADCEAKEDGMIIRGGAPLSGSVIDPHADHRIAMSFAVAGLVCGNLTISDPDCVRISYPGFFQDLESLQK